MIAAWTAFKAFGTGKKAAIGLLVLLALVAVTTIVIKTATNWFDETLDRAEEKGAGAAVQAGQDLTLENIGDANEAADQIVRDVDNAKFRECLRGTRTPINCERYRKNEPVPD
jgi:hypothetical protein